MAHLLKINTSINLPVFMVDSNDHITPKTGLTLSVQLSKNGGSFAAMSGTVTEIGNGWYRLNLNTTDTNTAGFLAIHITATGADPTQLLCQVVGFDPYNSSSLGLSYLDANVSSRATDAGVWGYSTRTLTSFGTLVSDIWSYSTRTLTAFSTSLAVAVWDVLESAITTANSIGLKVKNNLDVAVSTRSTLTDSQVWSYGTRTLTSFGTLVSDIWNHASRTLTSFSTSLAVAVWDVLESAIGTANSIGVKVKTNLDATVSSRSTLTASQAADAVWDEPLNEHQNSGSTGAALAAAGSAGDPWATELPGNYGSGTAGYILGNRLDVAVSTRSTLTAAQAADAIWDEPLSEHQNAGSAGEALAAAGSAGDPWSTQLPGSYPSGSAGYILGNRLDTTVSSRSTLTDSQVWSYNSRTLTSFGTLVSDIWNHANRTLTSFSTSLAVAVWDVLESAIGTANSIGVKVKNNLDAAISTRSTLTDAQVWSYGTRTLTSFGNLVSDIWSYSTRTLTSFGTLVSDIWAHTTSMGVSVLTAVERAYRVLINKMKANSSTGDITLYADNDTSTAATGSVTESGTEVTRSRLTWL